MSTSILFIPFFVALLITFVVTPFVIKLAKKFKLIDDPKTHRHPAILHTKPVPRAGGVSMYISLLITTLIFLPLSQSLSAILVANFFVVLIGLLDDKYDISPYLRFVGNVFCASIVVFSGITIPFITNPLGGILHFKDMTFMIGANPITISLESVLAIVWIVWIMNMLNWSKGVDGQMPGIAAISSIIIGIASLRFSVLTDSNIHASQIAFILAGSAVGFLFFNFHPAKIFPGYSATVLGFTIGVLSILSGVKLATAVLVMGIPTADALFTIIRRILAKKSPFWHDRGHLHHLLLERGYSQRNIAFFYWLMSFLLGIVALTLSSRGKVFAIILVIVLVGGFILFLRYLSRERSHEA